ncbi:MAG: hypothetical protein AB1631_20625 [Acidobacteriota bacterium]
MAEDEVAQAPKRELTENEKLSRKESIAELASRYGSIAKLPAELVLARTKEAAVLLDGSKVTDADLKAAAPAKQEGKKPKEEK